MEKIDHIFVAGEGAEELSRIFNLERRKPVLSIKIKQYEGHLMRFHTDEWGLPRLTGFVKAHPELFQLETVGAVALDDGSVATATSAGGFPLKLPERIDDSPSIGCDTCVDNHADACSASGNQS